MLLDMCTSRRHLASRPEVVQALQPLHSNPTVLPHNRSITGTPPGARLTSDSEPGTWLANGHRPDSQSTDFDPDYMLEGRQSNACNGPGGKACDSMIPRRVSWGEAIVVDDADHAPHVNGYVSVQRM